MSKVIVTGLGLGRDFNVCLACNLNFSWLIDNPSALIWAEKIIVTRSAWEAQIKHSMTPREKAINSALEVAYDNDLIELVTPSDIFQEDVVSQDILNSVERDMSAMLNSFPESIRIDQDNGHNQFMIGDEGYCIPYVASIYAGMKLSEELDANCLFDERDIQFLKYKYGLQTNNKVKSYMPEALSKIFELYIPNTPIFPPYVFRYDDECAEAKCKKCESTYLSEIEKQTKTIFKWRNYDEIYQAKEVVESIVKSKKFLNDDINMNDVKKEFLSKQNVVNRNIKKIFPMIKRWTNLTAIIATPLSIFSAASGNAIATIAGTSMLGISKVADESMKYYENKNKWVGFLNKTTQM